MGEQQHPPIRTMLQSALMHQAAGWFWGFLSDKKQPSHLREFAYGWLKNYLLAFGSPQGHVTEAELERLRPSQVAEDPYWPHW